MEGPQVKISLDKLHKALKVSDNYKTLKTLAKTSLKEMAERHQLEEGLVTPLLDELVEKILEESKKFSPKLPYPPVAANNLSVQIELPVKGKIGLTEMNTIVVV